jgi:lipase chaperone LimK
MRTLRGRYFSAQESGAMFGREYAEQQDSWPAVGIRQDRRLSAEQQREERAAPPRIARLEKSVEQMRARGAGDEEVFRARASALHPEAARRLAEVDRDEAHWRRRIAT